MRKDSLSFREDGTFTVLHIADTQEVPNVSRDTAALIAAALQSKRPDLAVFSGDILKGYSINYRFKKTRRRNVLRTLDGVFAPLVLERIPFCVTFGNHDEQCGFSHDELSAIMAERYPTYLVPEQSDYSVGTFFVPVQKDGKDVFGVYLFDSKESENGEYFPVTKEEIEWFEATNARENFVPAAVFQHIPVPEFYSLLRQVKRSHLGAVRAFRAHKGKHYIIDPKHKGKKDFMKEPLSVPDQNTGELAALAKNGNILSLFCGHDHKNCFSGVVDGVLIGYTPSCGFNEYGPSVLRGVRFFEYNAADLRAFQASVYTYKENVSHFASNPIKDIIYNIFPTSKEALFLLLLRIFLIGGAAAAVILFFLWLF